MELTHLMGTDEISADMWPRELSLKLVGKPGAGMCLGLQHSRPAHQSSMLLCFSLIASCIMP